MGGRWWKGGPKAKLAKGKGEVVKGEERGQWQGGGKAEGEGLCHNCLD